MSTPVLALALPDYFYFVFAICALVSICVVLFYAKRHPNPHFRPRKSDVGIMSVVLLFLSGGVAFMTAGALDTDFDKEKMEQKAEEAQRMARVKGTSAEEELGLTEGEGTGTAGAGSSKSKTGGASDLPEELPEELREFLQP